MKCQFFRFQILFLAFSIFLFACSANNPVPVTTIPEPSPVDSPTPSKTPTPSPTATPTITPTPLPMTPAEIFDRVSPSVAYVETETGSGSGVLINGNYIVTNAHVVWPFDIARVVFPDGAEFNEAPVINWDLMGDLAVIGPIDTNIQPLPLIDGENQVIGSDVYLVGYPGEVEKFPQPAISRGLISRVREWDPIEMSYFQTDATIAGGQSGGVLVSERAEIIGISGFSFADAEFGLVASAADVLPRIENLIEGEDVDELENRQPIQTNTATSQLVTLDNYWDSAVFIIEEPINTTVTLKLDGTHDYEFLVSDVFGNEILHKDDVYTGKEVGEFKIEIDAPYYLTIYQFETFSTFANLVSNVSLTPYRDRDGLQKLTMGQNVKGNIDYPGDYDTYRISLKKGEIFNLRIESVMVDPFLSIDIEGMNYSNDELIGDDNTGGGIFGLDAELSYEAPQNGTYFINIGSSYHSYIGGYVLTIDEPYEGAPTPSAPLPTATPISTDLGNMKMFESPGYPVFSIQYPADWRAQYVPDTFTQTCNTQGISCFANEYGAAILILLQENLNGAGLSSISPEAYGDLYLDTVASQLPGYRFLGKEQFENSQGLFYEVVHFTVQDGLFETWRLLYLDEETSMGFNASYLLLAPNELPDDEDTIALLEEYNDQILSSIQYSWSTLKIEK